VSWETSRAASGARWPRAPPASRPPTFAPPAPAPFWLPSCLLASTLRVTLGLAAVSKDRMQLWEATKERGLKWPSSLLVPSPPPTSMQGVSSCGARVQPWPSLSHSATQQMTKAPNETRLGRGRLQVAGSDPSPSSAPSRYTSR
jgi:hypothetical protein